MVGGFYVNGSSEVLFPKVMFTSRNVTFFRNGPSELENTELVQLF